MKNRWPLVLVILAVGLLCACSLACGASALLWAREYWPTAETLGDAASPGFEGGALPATPGATGDDNAPEGIKRITPELEDGYPDESGGLLRLAGDLPPTLDPALVQDSTSAEYVVHLFSGLVTLNSALEILPDLATEWELENEGRTYVFALNPEATFADGSPITAEDVIYSWERACSPELASPVATGYLGDITGVEDYASGAAPGISGLEARDPHTLAVTIDAPKSYFLAKLTSPAAMVVDRAQIQAVGDRWVLTPNGSGPFTLETFSEELIVLERNPRYYGEPARVERVEFELSGGLPITMYENDQLDIVGVWADELDRVRDPYNPLSGELYITSELSTEYLAMNVTRPPFDDPAVRLAILKAIDREKLARLVLNSGALPARGILPPDLVDDSSDRARDAMAYDPEEARRLLASSRYAASGAMPEIVLSISGTSGYMPPTTEAVLAMLEENLGLVATVEQVEWSSFLDDLNLRRYTFYSSGWIADYPDPQNFLDLLFHSRSSQNHVGYANAQVDALLEEARVEQDHERRMALYQEAELLILQDAPWVPLTHGVSYTLAKPWVKGYEPAAGLYPWLKGVSIVE